jgi:hypothetical protein
MAERLALMLEGAQLTHGERFTFKRSDLWSSHREQLLALCTVLRKLSPGTSRQRKER